MRFTRDFREDSHDVQMAHQELLDEASGKSTREVKEQVAALAPRPDTPLRVRWLPEPIPPPRSPGPVIPPRK
jgi:hypothetical protein